MAKIGLATDNIFGNSTDTENLNKADQLFQQAGHEVLNNGVGPNKTQEAARSNPVDIMVQIAGGKCLGTLIDFHQGCGSYYNAQQGGFLYLQCYDPNWKACRAHDDGFSKESDIQKYAGKTLPEIYAEMPNMFFGYGETIEECVSTFLANWSGQNIGAGGGANVVEGHIFSQQGEPAQYWCVENYNEPEKIVFTNYELQEEYPRVRTANFETPVNIDLTEGRVAVLITGECNDFGGIIIKKDYDSKTKLFKYQCQGFMERIMSAPVYVVANGGKTAHRLIQEYLDEIGLPDVELGEEDDYDVFVENAELRQKLMEEEENAESTDVFNGQDDFMVDADGDEPVAVITEGESHSEDYTVINTFKRKPVGLYDKQTGGDWIRTMIFDYGIDVDFYGDVNGIPHFDVMDMDEWTTKGWHLGPDMGFEQDYQYGFDITNIVTQVGVKNISAINGNGELYTAEELLGIKLENYVGRMGTIVDNPSAKGSTGNSTQTGFMGEDGQMYDASQVITTNGEPSCSKCAEKNGGSKPEQKKYTCYWVNKCMGCETEGKLTSDSEGQGKTVCEECGLEYCQYCGHEKKSGSYKLIECTQTTTSVGGGVATGAGSVAGGSSTGGGSGSSSGGSSSSSIQPGKSAKRLASDYKDLKKASQPAPGKSAKRRASDTNDLYNNPISKAVNNFLKKFTL